MNGFNSYKSDLGFDIGSGLSEQSTYIKKKDEQNNRILMEEQYKSMQTQKVEILAQQKYRREQSQDAKIEKRLLIFNTIIAIAALLVSLFK
ncbi:hypothetical protein SAMN05444376_3046 [Bacteroides clarus YIT 12056]|uniref:Conserved domain protein n=1 Tax=Bacteroides clarus YIT 12056 TaxID=762984 RepID=A0ABP2KVV0_9BACE|nr:hypothetical protein [Bacteroides clarus]EGF54932.1 conserved domain protein [Bacteroides clarus YIT 12056]SHH33712.1 hypothetical protein SAMN05444376_3046 [Bacteroides clarus YIT 12056]